MGHRHGRLSLAVFAALLLALTPAVALAHGPSHSAPTPLRLLTAWEIDPFFLFPVLGSLWLYLAGVRRVKRLHPRSPFPRKRITCFLIGIAALLLAGASPIAVYEGDLFAVHMVQHMLIMMVAAPFLLLGTPITLALRASTPEFRRGVLLPILHSRVARAISFPVLTWFVLAATVDITHFSPFFNEALENAWWHRAEHLWYMIAALLFWWPVVSLEPGPWRLNHPVRMFYVFLQMPQNSFVAVAIYETESVIFKHYATVTRTWGPSPIADQSMAGIIMWIGGDFAFLIALAVLAYGWVQKEEREAKRQDRALAREKAARRAAEAEAAVLRPES